MPPVTVNIDRFDAGAASEPECMALHAFTSRMRAELMPDDPPTPLAEAIAAWRHLQSLGNTTVWVARQPDEPAIVARGQVSHLYPIAAENQHVVRASIQVLPEHRRQGVARALLAPIAHAMRDQERRLLITETSGRAPAGASFMERLGGERGLETRTYQLDIASLNQERVREWQARAVERAADFELGFWDGPFAEADLAAIADLNGVMNTQPLGSLAIQHHRMTPAQLRQIESALLARGTQRWTMYVRERATGRLAGFTEVFWKPSAPALMAQGNTGVFPEHRGRGLGRWLKAAMLDKVLRERPQVRRVRTGNADSNAAMLEINRELGFEPRTSQIVWQLKIEKLEDYLRSRDPSPAPSRERSVKPAHRGSA